MCGRYSLNARAEELVELFKLAEAVSFEPRYNIAPTQPAPIIRQDFDSEARRLALVGWGITPHWWKEPRPIINVRSETAEKKYGHAMRHHRCLVPATGFYEWQKLNGAKQPFHIHFSDQPIIALAGIWDQSFPDDERVSTFAILTTTPNEVVAPLHDRMPVVVAPDGWSRWLDPMIEDVDALADLMTPAPEKSTLTEPVSCRVNSPANDDARCIDPLEGGAPNEQETLFG